jgi:hypothetical protein
MSTERLSGAKLWLTSTAKGDAPYLSAALYAMPTVLTTEIDTISADDHWRVYLNPTDSTRSRSRHWQNTWRT